MRRVVGRKAVDHVEVAAQRLTVGARGQARAHFASARADSRNILFCQEEVVRRNLTRDAQALALGRANQFDLVLAADVADVHRAVEQVGGQDRGGDRATLCVAQ